MVGNPDDPTLRANLQKMNLVIQDAGRTVTFVQASGLDIRVDYNPLDALQPPTLFPPNRPNVPANQGAFYGLAFALKSKFKVVSARSVAI